MTLWQEIYDSIEVYKNSFNKAYKCVNKNIYIRPQTVRQHISTLIVDFNKISKIIAKYELQFVKEHKEIVTKIYWDLRDKLVKIFNRYNIKYELPHCFKIQIEFNIHSVLLTDKNLTLQEIEEEEEEEENEKEEDEDKHPTDPDNTNSSNTMTQTVEQFIATASRFIFDFDGKSVNLQSFIDGLTTVDLIKGDHEDLAVSLIKTKLKDSARQLITNETTIEQIIKTLKTTIRGEPVEVLTAKLMSIQQKDKTANVYTKEVEDLAKAIKSAYISDGVPLNVAEKYTTKAAVTAMVNNCNMSEVKLIMKSGNFTSLNEAVQKFVESCTDSHGKSDMVLYYKQNNSPNNYRGNNHGRYRGNNSNRGGYRGYHNNGRNNNNRGGNNYYNQIYNQNIYINI